VGSLEIPCYVLENGTRVLSGRGVPRLGPGDLLSGFQIDSEARPRADAPEWVFNDAFLRRVLSASKETGRPKNIARWAACLYLYYRCSWDYRRIGDAEEDIDDSDRDFDFLVRKIKAEGLPESPKVREAIEKGELWAKNASPENILRLPKKQCLAVIWHFWGSLSYSECGSTMCLDKYAVYQLLRRAKKSLARGHTP